MAAVSSRYARAFADVVMERKLEPSQVRRDLHSLFMQKKGKMSDKNAHNTATQPAAL